MWKKGFVALAVVMVAVAGLTVSKQLIAANAKPAGEGVSKETCYGCHEEVKALKEGSRHANLGCGTCHENLVKHAESQGDVKPVTKIDAALCGKCHKDQFESFYKSITRPAPARKRAFQQAARPCRISSLQATALRLNITNRAVTPSWSSTSSSLTASRAAVSSSRMAGWAIDATGKAWDVLIDTGKRLPETAMAGNPTCIQCKTSDHILKWKFMGDKGGQMGSDL